MGVSTREPALATQSGEQESTPGDRIPAPNKLPSSSQHDNCRSATALLSHVNTSTAPNRAPQASNELPPQQATGYQDSRLTGSGASSGELTRFRTEPSSARHGSSVTLVNE
jgi:hypothetical protein